ncbi:MAG: hypothetical protein ACRDFS_01645 [Chloroflexota bacterium]
MTSSPHAAARFPGGPLVVSTVGMAVADLQAGMAAYSETLGWSPWTIYRQEPPGLQSMRYHGAPAEFSFLVAGTTSPGGTAFWLCQPLEGPSLYRDLVEEQIPGPHFMTVWRQTKAENDAVLEWLTERGASELMSARMDDSIEFTFLDARAICGMILETGFGKTVNQQIYSTYP